MKNKFPTFLGFFVVALLVFGSMSTALQDATIQVPKKMTNVFVRLAPQGWSFFTRNPREELMHVYALKDEKVLPAFYNNANSFNLFGVSRKSRRLGFEFSALLQKIGRSEWKDYTGDDYRPLLDEASTHTVPINEVVKNVAPGKYLAVMETSVPWAWIATYDTKHRQNRYVIIEVLAESDFLANH